MESGVDIGPRTYYIRRNQHLGYGFVAGSEAPTIVKSVEPSGPSYTKLLPGDLIMAVNGINVENAPREQIINMIIRCHDQIEITVRQPTYEDMLRARNQTDFKFLTLNKSATNLSHPSTPNHFGIRQPPPLPSNPSPLNRLVTSISQQKQPGSPISPSRLRCTSEATPPNSHQASNPLSRFAQVLQPKSNNATDQDNQNYTRTLGGIHKGYGCHSPIPQRCKSSMDIAQNCKLGKKNNEGDNNLPLLKRSNTMRPIKPPAKVMEILEVVIMIFFEDGRTRKLTYNQDTTVGTILKALNERQTGTSPYSEEIKRYFGLVLTFGINSDGIPKEQLPKRNQLHVLAENDPIMGLRHLPYWRRLRFLYRMVHPPIDVGKLYTQDKVAFDYLYRQSCNDLKLERFDPELDQEIALKLSALHLLEYIYTNSKAHQNSKDPKVYIRLVKKSPGIEFFLPISLSETTIDKKGKRIVGQYKKLRNRLILQLKKNFEEFDFEPTPDKTGTTLNRLSSSSFHDLSLVEMQNSPNDYIKLIFLKCLSQQPCYGNSKRPIRASASPAGQNSTGECSSSLESVPRTSDSSPLIKNRDQASCQAYSNGRSDNTNSITRLAQMNSMRSLSSVQSSSNSQPIEKPEMDIESISSITFNMQNSPSPQQAPFYQSQMSETYPVINDNQPMVVQPVEPSPMPRQQIVSSKAVRDYNTVEKLYSQRYTVNTSSVEIDELLRKAVLLPPPPPPLPALSRYDDKIHQNSQIYGDNIQMNHLTQILTDRELEGLKVPPPPRMFN